MGIRCVVFREANVFLWTVFTPWCDVVDFAMDYDAYENMDLVILLFLLNGKPPPPPPPCNYHVPWQIHYQHGGGYYGDTYCHLLRGIVGGNDTPPSSLELFLLFCPVFDAHVHAYGTPALLSMLSNNDNDNDNAAAAIEAYLGQKMSGIYACDRVLPTEDGTSFYFGEGLWKQLRSVKWLPEATTTTKDHHHHRKCALC